MDLIVCHLTKCNPNSMVASIRIAKFLENRLDIRLLDEADERVTKQHWDAVLLVNGPTGFADTELRWQISRIINDADNFIFVQNDYKLLPPSQIKKICKEEGREGRFTFSTNVAAFPRWGTVAENFTGHPLDYYVNWNILTYKPLELREPTQQGIIYWGAFRKGREEAFSRYLNTDKYKVTISTSKASFKYFNQYAPKAHLTDKLKDLTRDIQHFPASVYIEDDWSNEYFCSPANRFYEAVSSGIALFIDEPCVKNLRNSGIQIPGSFIVQNEDDVQRLLPYAKDIAEEQSFLWRKDYMSQLDHQLNGAMSLLRDRVS